MSLVSSETRDVQNPTNSSNEAALGAPELNGNPERPIVCATDFSSTAADAANVAAALAQRLGTRLLLLHVVSGGAKDSVALETLLSEKREQLEREAARLRGGNMVIEQKLLCGPVADELVKVASERHARFLVIAAVGHGLAHRLLVGSVAERVAQTSPVPTLVVRPNSRLVQWAGEERPLKLVVGYDFSEGSAAALQCARELQQIPSCEVHTVYVEGRQHEDHRGGINGLGGAGAGAMNVVARELQTRVGSVLSGAGVTTAIFEGAHRADSHLEELANERKADLLIVGTRGAQHVHYGSVARALLHRGAISVAVARVAPRAAHSTQLPKFQRVLIATASHAPSTDAAVRFGCAMVNRGGQLKILQMPVKGRQNGVALRPKTIREVRLLLPKKAAEEYDIQLDVCCPEEPLRGIAHEAELFQADLICVAAPKANGNGTTDVLERLVAMTHCPVLVLPSQN